jgi:hypothetical protein
VPENGTYTFRTRSNDGVQLTIDGKKLVDQWKIKPNMPLVGDPITLESSKYYPFNLRWFDHENNAILKLFWRRDETDEWAIVPPTVFKLSAPGAPGAPGSEAAAAEPVMPLPRGEGPGLQLRAFRSDHEGKEIKALSTGLHNGVIDFNWGSGPILDTKLRNKVLLDFSGYIRAPKSGAVTFRTQTDDGIWLKVADRLLVDQWQSLGMTYNTGTDKVEMQEGEYYPIHLRWFENQGGAILRLFWKHDMDDWSIVPMDVFHQQPEGGVEAEAAAPEAGADGAGTETDEEEAAMDMDMDADQIQKSVNKKITPKIKTLKKIHDKLHNRGPLSASDRAVVKKIGKRVRGTEKKLRKQLNIIKKRQRNINVKLTKLAEGQENLSKMGTFSQAHGDTGRANHFKNSKNQLAFNQGVLSGHEQRLQGIENKLFALNGGLTEIKMILRDIGMKLQSGYQCQIMKAQAQANPSMNQLRD